MAKKIKRILALCMILVLSISMIATPAVAKSNSSSSTDTEWYKVIVNGNTVASASGKAGDHTWLVQGVYKWSVSISGTSMTWKAGKHSGTVNLANYISIPEGFEIADGGYTVEHKSVEGTNSQSANFDNAIITVVISALYNPTTQETLPVEPNPTEPPATEPPVTEPPATEPPVTEPPVTEPPATEPPVTEPPVTEPPATEPPATEPPATEPPVTEPPVTEPPVTEPPATEPPAPVETKVTVNHIYKTFDIYTGDTTEDGRTNTVADAIEGDSYTATAVTTYGGNVYEQTGAEPGMTITIQADAAANVINIEYLRTIDTTPIDYEPTVSVTKTAGKDVYKEGDTITWDITVRNTSAYTAYDVVVSDALTGDTWTIAALAPNNAVVFTATLRNAPAGAIKNVVVASWDDNDEIPDEDEPEEPKITSDEEVVIVEEPINYTPVVTISKTADKATYETGETIKWFITVKNISEHTAYNVVVSDELTGDIWTIETLAPGAEQAFQAETLAEAAGSVKNVVVVSWDDNDEIPDEDEPNEIKTTGDEEVVGVDDPAPENYIPVLDVIKTAEDKEYKEGDSILFNITVKNVSEYTAYNVTVVDRLVGGYWIIPSLAPGAEQTFTAVMKNVAAGSVKNTVVVNWEDGDEIPDEEEPNEVTETSDEEVVTVRELYDYEPVLQVVKTANKSSYKKGDTIKWTIKVKNISDYTAYNVFVYDELTDDSWYIEALEPGAEQTFKATTKNAKAGTVKNVVVVSWEDGDEIPDAEEPNEITVVTDEETVKVKEPVDPKPVDPNPTEPESNDPEQPTKDDPAELVPQDTPAAQAGDGEIEIADEEVPLADAPKTGDVSAIWIALSSLSAGGMIVLGKKREEDEE